MENSREEQGEAVMRNNENIMGGQKSRGSLCSVSKSSQDPKLPAAVNRTAGKLILEKKRKPTQNSFGSSHYSKHFVLFVILPFVNLITFQIIICVVCGVLFKWK